ncbi:MAG: acyltransferase family protein [Terracidiphilus sp.]
MSNPSLVPTRAGRLLSLDVLRGVTIAFMIMVNNNGGEGSWWFMNHAAWNGLTPTDLVFPTFMFVMGASIVLSVNARLARGATRAQVTWHTLRRAGLLFLFGLVGNGFPFFRLEHLRVYGVLQRLAICYLVVALFYLWDRRVWTKIAALVALLAGYWILVRWVPVPGAGLPGRDIPFLDPNVNIVNWVDQHIFPHHLYEDWTTHNLRDPEGLLSNIPAIGTVLLGLLTGLWLRAQKSAKTKTLGLAAGAVVCLATGYLWSLSFPLNKKMWTSSYVLVAAGYSLVVFTIAYWAVEQRGWGKGRGKAFAWPWLVLGSNAIVAYMFSELLGSSLGNISFTADGGQTDVPAWVFNHVFANIPDPGWAAFAWSVSFLVVCFVPVWLLYRKKIFIKV